MTAGPLAPAGAVIPLRRMDQQYTADTGKAAHDVGSFYASHVVLRSMHIAKCSATVTVMQHIMQMLHASHAGHQSHLQTALRAHLDGRGVRGGCLERVLTGVKAPLWQLIAVRRFQLHL